MSTRVDPVSLTQQLVRFDTVNPTSPELDCARFLAELLEDGGFRVRLHEFAPGRASLVARSAEVRGAPLCFAGHLDTVPLGAAPWKRDPFAGETDGGRALRPRLERHEERHRGDGLRGAGPRPGRSASAVPG